MSKDQGLWGPSSPPISVPSPHGSPSRDRACCPQALLCTEPRGSGPEGESTAGLGRGSRAHLPSPRGIRGPPLPWLRKAPSPPAASACEAPTPWAGTSLGHACSTPSVAVSGTAACLGPPEEAGSPGSPGGPSARPRWHCWAAPGSLLPTRDLERSRLGPPPPELNLVSTSSPRLGDQADCRQQAASFGVGPDSAWTLERTRTASWGCGGRRARGLPSWGRRMRELLAALLAPGVHHVLNAKPPTWPRRRPTGPPACREHSGATPIPPVPPAQPEERAGPIDVPADLRGGNGHRQAL